MESFLLFTKLEAYALLRAAGEHRLRAARADHHPLLGHADFHRGVAQADDQVRGPRGRDQPRSALLVPGPAGTSRITAASSSLYPLSATSATPSGG
jgi:hypothetical protein